MNQLEIINLQQLFDNGPKITSGRNRGKSIIERNLEIMKSLTEEEVDEIFENYEFGRYLNEMNEYFHLNGSTIPANSPAKRTYLVVMTRKHVVRALKKICLSHLESSVPGSIYNVLRFVHMNAQHDTVAFRLISKEHILAKFADAVAKYQRFQGM